MHFIIKIILSMTVLFMVIGCRTHTPCPGPMQNLRQICLDLRRQLIFYNTDFDPTHYAGNWNSPTRQAELLKRYCQYDCATVLRENPLD